MKVATLNLNGLRSALRRGLLEWLEREAPGVLLLQEVRADPLPEVFAGLGYHSLWHPAERAGYSGVALLGRQEFQEVRVGIGDALLDAEGRLVSGRLDGVRFASLYLPSGSGGEVRQTFKERSLELLGAWTRERLAEGPLVIGGDFNLAHHEIDLHNWRGNRRNSGFLPQERAWMTAYLELGLRDAHRDSLGGRAEYTWWSNRSGAYGRDVGWRIDYLLSSGVRLEGMRALREARLSDHAPLSATLVGGLMTGAEGAG